MTIATSLLSDIRAQIDADKIEEAQAALNSVKETDENRAEIRFLRGRAMERTFDREAALTAYQQALELDPDNTEVAFRAAVLSEQCGDEDAALALYEKCASVSPAPVNALINPNPDPTVAVRFGDQTSEEMTIGYFDYVVPIQGTE